MLQNMANTSSSAPIPENEARASTSAPVPDETSARMGIPDETGPSSVPQDEPNASTSAPVPQSKTGTSLGSLALSGTSSQHADFKGIQKSTCCSHENSSPSHCYWSPIRPHSALGPNPEYDFAMDRDL